MCLFKSISMYTHRVHALTYYILDSSIRHTSMSRRYSAYSDLVCYQRRRLRRPHVLGRPHSRWSTLEPPSCAAASCITALALRGTARECTRLEVVEGLRRQTLPTVVHTREPAAATAACFDSGEARMVLCAASMGPGSPSPHAQRSSQSHPRTRWLSHDLLRSTCWAA